MLFQHIWVQDTRHYLKRQGEHGLITNKIRSYTVKNVYFFIHDKIIQNRHAIKG